MTKKQSSVFRYRILTLCWSVQQQAFLAPGTIVEFDMSETAEYKPNVERLVERGAIELYTGEWPVPAPEPEITAGTEVDNG